MQQKQRKIPLRTCIGCGIAKPKKELVRVVRDPEGQLSVDLTGKKNGRGAYICHSAECLKKARKARRLEKSFSMQIPEEVYDELTRGLAADE
ncbi:MAG: YlxR family protein [Clostridia bacterium]|nr:YlxR family protein [Clostridia bacterium]MBQ1554270.1 YlxR family protein [Clostridia bacterium]MBQ4396528.1 YlxR family protein [Clostridia bacterium]